jgi:hypothetical protein
MHSTPSLCCACFEIPVLFFPVSTPLAFWKSTKPNQIKPNQTKKKKKKKKKKIEKIF